MNQATLPALVIRRTYEATPEQLYAAWTDPATLRKFLAPAETSIADVQVDATVGGTFRFDYRVASNEIWSVTGTYKEVSPPRKLSMTWRWLEDNPQDERETLLTLEFNPQGSQTELVLRHELFASEESRAGHEHGWTSTLENLAATLGSRS